jgi:hypothetical protein
MDKDRFVENLTHQVEENPVLALGVAAALFGSLSKLINSAAWKKEVNRRAKKDRSK